MDADGFVYSSILDEIIGFQRGNLKPTSQNLNGVSHSLRQMIFGALLKAESFA